MGRFLGWTRPLHPQKASPELGVKTMKKYYWLLSITALTMAASGANAQFSDQNAKPEAPAALEAQSESPIMTMSELDSMRGGTQIAINSQTLNAENTGNTIGGDFTAGAVSLADVAPVDGSWQRNARSGFTGLGHFVFTPGAQAALQAGLSVTINISD